MDPWATFVVVVLSSSCPSGMSKKEGDEAVQKKNKWDEEKRISEVLFKSSAEKESFSPDSALAIKFNEE